MTENETDEVIRRFAEVSERYCALLELDPLPERDVLVRQVAALFSELYLAAIDLMEAPPAADVEFDSEIYIEHDEWQILYMRLGAAFGELNYYWEFFDPYINADMVTASLADDLADIYRDLKEGLIRYQRSHEAPNVALAVERWQHGFRYHWGDHLVDALRALHRILTGQVETDGPKSAS